MHGNDFFLMNMGFPETFKNGSIKGINNNLKCLDDACSKHEWNEEAIQASMIQLWIKINEIFFLRQKDVFSVTCKHCSDSELQNVFEIVLNN